MKASITLRETPQLVMFGRLASKLYLKKRHDRFETHNLAKQSENVSVAHSNTPSSFVFKTLPTPFHLRLTQTGSSLYRRPPTS